MYKKSDAIAVFDSGIGGLTVVESLKARLPLESITYLADTLHLPYGNKQKNEIEEYCFDNIEFLLNFPIKALIIACNTASALAYESLKKRFNIPIFDVITPVVELAVKSTKNQKIAVIATESTINSNMYELLIKKRLPKASVSSIACPLLVSVIEENMLSKKITKTLIKQYLSPLKNSEIDTLILGCTHYPIIKKLIIEEIDENIKVVDSAESVAKNVEVYLDENNLRNVKSEPKHCFFVSDNPASFEKKRALFFKGKTEPVKKMKD